MIVFYLRNLKIIKQYQLPDYIDKPKIISQNYKKYNITKPLEYFEYKLQKMMKKSIIPPIPQLNYTLEKYYNPSAGHISIISKEHSQNPNSIKNEIELQNIQELQPESCGDLPVTEQHYGSLLRNAINLRYYLRFPSIPPVQYEEFCHNIIPKTRYIHYQEQLKFKGCFIDMLLLHPLPEYAYYEIELRKKRWHPKGFSIQRTNYLLGDVSTQDGNSKLLIIKEDLRTDFHEWTLS